jgi:hypothetical protein
MNETPKVKLLDDEPTGDCPCGCGEVAFPFSVEGLDGYVDAAPPCAPKLALDALRIQESPT